jgi:hypothetical protein
MSYWALNHTWRNFCSMYREGTSADEACSKMDRAHHKSAAAYFGICALEAFINSKMRVHLSPTLSEEKIIEKLRGSKPNLSSRLRDWPVVILGRKLDATQSTFNLIEEIIDDRHHLTHSKTVGFETYDRLTQLDATKIISSVADYIVQYCQAENVQFPYWVFGWNYLNPSEEGSPTLMNNQQFSISLHSMGVITLTPLELRLTTWHEKNMKSYSSYESLSRLLAATEICQPKSRPYPRQPILCRRWWEQSHRKTCGHTMKDSDLFAL